MKIIFKEIKKAAKNIEKFIHKTKLFHSRTFSEIAGNNIYIKPENLQKAGSFKIRGASNKIINLASQEKKNGVIASSAGNHAQGVAMAASQNNIKSTIVMPQGAPIAKITATKNYGAEVVLYGDVFDETYEKAKEIQKQTDATFIHPFDDIDIITGQGTIGLEILEELPDVDIILVPIGGGGLISGVATAAKYLKHDIKIIGVESSGAASMKYSLEKECVQSLTEVNTLADGISIKTPGNITYDICSRLVDDIVTVDDEEISSAILMLLERAKMVAEGAGAVTIAAVLHNKINFKNKNIVTILSGGNIDFNIISRIIERGLGKAGRKTTIKTCLRDKPGHLQILLSLLAELNANIISIKHNHYQPGIAIDKAEVEIVLETKNKDHVKKIHNVLSEKGYKINKNCICD
ncbi:MAG: threonine ammonia-lyase [bacterium]